MSIWRDKRERWHVGVMHRGKRVHRVLPEASTREQARKLEIKIRQELFRVLDLGETPSISLWQALQRYVDEYVSHQKAAHKTRWLVASLEPWVSDKALVEVPLVAENVVTELRRRKLATASINRKLSVLKRVATLSYRKWGWLKEPLAHKIEKLPGEKSRQVYLDAIQVAQLVAALESQPAKDAVLVAAYTGLRRAELWSITRNMIRDNTIYLADSKAGTPRAVPIVPKVRAAVTRWANGGKINYNTFYKHYKAACRSLGLGHARFHDLRHSCASMLINSGASLYVVGQILGHTNPGTTAKYSHLTLDAKRKALRRIG